MKEQNKKEMILDAMQELMSTASTQTISVSDIAQRAGIGKGSIYYYFSSKNDIIEAVIERSYSRVLDQGQALACSDGMNALEKLEIIYQACQEASLELKRKEALDTFSQQQQSALIHQKCTGMIITRLGPILTDILRQGELEGTIRCSYTKEAARIILTTLTVTIDNVLAPLDPQEIRQIMAAFAVMLEKSLGLSTNSLDFLVEKVL